MRRVVLLLCLMSLATPALAQQRLFARLPGEVVELDPRPATLGTGGARPSPDSRAGY